MITDTKVFRKYICLLCGYIYDEEKGCPEDHILPGTRWEDVPINWRCPECGAMKEDFEMVEI
jgi:rubredoxin